MENLKNILIEEINDFNKIGHKFINGELNKMEFKGLSGGMGIYAQKDLKSFMVRLRISSGVMDLDKIKAIYTLATKYNLKDIHLTTRQAIQFHNLSIDDVCNLSKDGLEFNLYARGAGGNFPRNVALSPLSGVSADESFDPTQYAIAVNNHFISKITTYKLPRKLKVAFSNNMEDTAHCEVQDVGFLATTKNNKNYFKLYLGGGLGKNPKKAVLFDELVEPKDVLYHIEAITSLFIAEGDYENKNRARIRYILERMGEELFVNTYKKHLQKVFENESLDLNIDNTTISKTCNKQLDIVPNIIKQKQEGLYSVYVQPIGGILTTDKLLQIIKCAENIAEVDFRLSSEEGMYIRNLTADEAKEMIKITDEVTGSTRLATSVSCIGVPTCQIGVLESQKTLNEIISYFNMKNANKDLLPKVFISGCPNSCGVHQIGAIGFTGKKKRVNDTLKNVFELHIGGKLGYDAAELGKIYGDILEENIPEFLYTIYTKLEESNIDFYNFIKDEKLLGEIIGKYIV